MEWLPIKTAPTDGTRILLFDGFEMYVAAWGICDMRGNTGWVYAECITDMNNYEKVYYPTHWMTLPERPITNGEK
jgi:hypothetical protein